MFALLHMLRTCVLATRASWQFGVSLQEGEMKKLTKQQETIASLKDDPQGIARSAAQVFRRLTGIKKIDATVVFGSGWDPAVRRFGRAIVEFPAILLPGFLPPSVKGHAGMIRVVRIGTKLVLVFRGRKHNYEFRDGDGMDAVVHYVRVARALGCRTFIHTNAVGGLRPGLKVGQAVLIRDHNDIISRVPSPLQGTTKFLECSRVYSARLRTLCKKIDPSLTEGIIAQVGGPHFETQSVADFLRRNGVDVVGMSMIQEAIIAHAMKMAFLGISLVTDPAGEKITHAQVMAVVKRRAPKLGELIRRIIERM